MKPIIIKSSNNIELIMVVIFISGMTLIVTQSLLYTVIAIVTSIIGVYLIGNKTIIFKDDNLCSYYDLSPFKRKNSILYKDIISVEIRKPLMRKIPKNYLNISYRNGDKRKELRISLNNSYDNIDDIINRLKSKGVKNIKHEHFTIT